MHTKDHLSAKPYSICRSYNLLSYNYFVSTKTVPFRPLKRTKTFLTGCFLRFINTLNMSTDNRFIKRCIDLAHEAFQKGDSPFGALVARGDKIIVEATNSIVTQNDITAHAEIIAIRQTQKIIEHSDLSKFVLYSSCEPCPMCSFMIREAKFRKVVFSLRSPSMGGLSKWNILQDADLEHFPPYFSKIPKIISGINETEMTMYYDAIGWDKYYKKVVAF